jgi:hypothetical protein
MRSRKPRCTHRGPRARRAVTGQRHGSNVVPLLTGESAPSVISSYQGTTGFTHVPVGGGGGGGDPELAANTHANATGELTSRTHRSQLSVGDFDGVSSRAPSGASTQRTAIRGGVPLAPRPATPCPPCAARRRAPPRAAARRRAPSRAAAHAPAAGARSRRRARRRRRAAVGEAAGRGRRAWGWWRRARGRWRRQGQAAALQLHSLLRGRNGAHATRDAPRRQVALAPAAAARPPAPASAVRALRAWLAQTRLGGGALARGVGALMGRRAREARRKGARGGAADGRRTRELHRHAQPREHHAADRLWRRHEASLVLNLVR